VEAHQAELKNAGTVDSTVTAPARDLDLDEAGLPQETLTQPLEGIW
jgi:hypothetical protein